MPSYMATKQLQLVDVVMKSNGQRKAWKHTEAGARFIARSIQSGVPANCFIVVDTHADTLSGGLQWGGGTTSSKTAAASEVVGEFCGKKFLQEMQKASNAASNFAPPQTLGWYEGSPFLRGGWRGLFVASCAPAVRVRNGFLDLRRMVEE